MQTKKPQRKQKTHNANKNLTTHAKKLTTQTLKATTHAKKSQHTTETVFTTEVI